VLSVAYLTGGVSLVENLRLSETLRSPVNPLAVVGPVCVAGPGPNATARAISGRDQFP